MKYCKCTFCASDGGGGKLQGNWKMTDGQQFRSATSTLIISKNQSSWFLIFLALLFGALLAYDIMIILWLTGRGDIFWQCPQNAFYSSRWISRSSNMTSMTLQCDIQWRTLKSKFCKDGMKGFEAQINQNQSSNFSGENKTWKVIICAPSWLWCDVWCTRAVRDYWPQQQEDGRHRSASSSYPPSLSRGSEIYSIDLNMDHDIISLH